MVTYLDERGARYLVRKVLDRIQPVGSLYFSTNSTSPASLFGGTWERYASSLRRFCRLLTERQDL